MVLLPIWQSLRWRCTVGHDPVVVADAGDADVLHGAATGIERAEFARISVAVADFQAGRFTGVLLVLRHRADRAELENHIVAADAGVAFDHGMRADLATGADHDVRTDDCEYGADFY